MMLLRLLPPLLPLLALMSACADGGNAPPTPIPTQDTFNPNTMSTIGLRPEDVGMASGSQGFSDNPASPSYSVTYGDDAFRIQSTVTRVVDPIEREQQFASFRNFFAMFARNERTYALEATDQAFAYRSFEFNTPRESVLILSGDFIAYVDISSNIEARSSDVHNAAIDDFIKTVVTRIEASSDARLTP